MIFVAICWLIVVSLPSYCAACPNCKDALENDSSSIQSGYAVSIGLMMSTPFLIFAAWTCWIYLACRKANQLEAKADTQRPIILKMSP
jgi:hypothetical protein